MLIRRKKQELNDGRGLRPGKPSPRRKPQVAVARTSDADSHAETTEAPDLNVIQGGRVDPAESAPEPSVARLDFAAHEEEEAQQGAPRIPGESSAEESTPVPAVPRQPLLRAISAVSSSGQMLNEQYSTDFEVTNPGWKNLGGPEDLIHKLDKVGYQCYHYLAVQLALLFNTDFSKIRALLLEGPSGCGKSFMAKSLAKICGAELMCLSCYKGMPTQNLIESPSTLAMVNSMTGKTGEIKVEDMMNLGILSRAYLKSQQQPVLLLIDELDKPEGSIDTFFLGPIQDSRIWLESRSPIDANNDNLLIVFTKNWNRTLDEALLRRVHPVRMTYLDSALEKKILSPHCHPQLVANLVTIADRMRNTGGSYAFERPPAPEELLTAGHYVTRLLEWGMQDFGFVGKNIWSIVAKSEHDRAVLEHMMRFHPDFMDPLCPDGRNAPIEEIHSRLGRIVLNGIINDPKATQREAAWKNLEYN